MHRLERNAHEIGLHAMHLENKIEEKNALEEKCLIQKEIFGEAWHGGGGGDYFLGHPSVKAAMEAGMLYTELAPTIYDFPTSGFPALHPNGLVATENIIGITHTASTDTSIRKGMGLHKLNWVKELLRHEYHCVLLNHPDKNFHRLKAWVDEFSEDDRVDWTCFQLAHWWKRTHQRNNLRITRINQPSEDSVWAVESAFRIDDLELRISSNDEAVWGVDLDFGQGPKPAHWEYASEKDSRFIRIRANLEPNTSVRILIKKCQPAQDRLQFCK
jgi:hypothetical protein